MFTLDEIDELKRLILSAEVIHLYTHAYPDGDAVASMAAVDYVLRSMDESRVSL